jgi:hypothetical protein
MFREDRRAAQAVRQSVSVTTTASPTTLATVTATASSLLEPADGCSFAPNCVPTTTAPSDSLAAATAPQLPEPAFASLAGPRRSPGPGDTVPRRFPGEKGILRPNMIPFMIVIFSLIEVIQPHVHGVTDNDQYSLREVMQQPTGDRG